MLRALRSEELLWLAATTQRLPEFGTLPVHGEFRVHPRHPRFRCSLQYPSPRPNAPHRDHASRLRDAQRVPADLQAARDDRCRARAEAARGVRGRSAVARRLRGHAPGARRVPRCGLRRGRGARARRAGGDHDARHPVARRRRARRSPSRSRATGRCDRITPARHPRRRRHRAHRPRALRRPLDPLERRRHRASSARSSRPSATRSPRSRSPARSTSRPRAPTPAAAPCSPIPRGPTSPRSSTSRVLEVRRALGRERPRRERHPGDAIELPRDQGASRAQRLHDAARSISPNSRRPKAARPACLFAAQSRP